MIRIPRYWAYLLFAVICCVLALQKDNYLLSFLSISTSFNYFARFGFLIWACWLLLLGIRGHVIFWSSFNISYADFYGGYKILWILFGLGSFFLFIGSFSFSYQINSTSLPPTAKPPTRIASTSSRIPIKIDRSTPTAQIDDCIHWTDVSSLMEGQNICVYGEVESYYNTTETATRINFSSNKKSIFLYDMNYYYPDLKVGDCVVAKDILRLYNNEIPYLSISELFKCASWMK